MIKNPVSGRLVKIEGKTGATLIAMYSKGHIKLDQRDEDMLKEAQNIVNEALMTKQMIEKHFSALITPTLRNAGNKIDSSKFTSYLQKLTDRHIKKSFCLMPHVLAKEIIDNCCSQPMSFDEKTEFISFFKTCLKSGHIQLGGGKVGSIFRGCAYTVGIITGAILTFTIVLAPLGVLTLGTVAAHMVYTHERKDRKRKQKMIANQQAYSYK